MESPQKRHQGNETQNRVLDQSSIQMDQSHITGGFEQPEEPTQLPPPPKFSIRIKE